MMQHDLVARPLGIPETLGTSSLDPRWKPLAERDTNADGTFVYGVTSTGIYCRPGCPSRRPRADRWGADREKRLLAVEEKRR